MTGTDRGQRLARDRVVEFPGASAHADTADALALDLPFNAAYAAALSAARAMPLWRIVTEDPAAGRIVAEATTARAKFVDDVEIAVEPAETGSRVRVRSASRVGITDFGTNARRVRSFLSRLATNAPR